MSDDERYKQAKARMEALKGFYSHLAIYLIVNAGLLLTNALTSDNWWFYWPLIGWGIGLTIHALTVFILGPAFGPGWEQRKIREYMRETTGPDSPVKPPTPTP